MAKCQFVDVDDEYGGESLFRVITDAQDVFAVSNLLSEKGYKLRDSKTQFLPVGDNVVEVPSDHEKLYGKAMDLLDEVSEITNIYTNVKVKREQ